MSSSPWRSLQQNSKRDGEREPLTRSSGYTKSRGGTTADNSTLNSKTASPGSNRAEFRSPKRPTAAAVLRGAASKSPPSLGVGEPAASAARGRAVTSARPPEERASRASSTPFGTLERRSSLGYDRLPAMPARTTGTGAAGEWDADTGRWKVVCIFSRAILFFLLACLLAWRLIFNFKRARSDGTCTNYFTVL